MSEYGYLYEYDMNLLIANHVQFRRLFGAPPLALRDIIIVIRLFVHSPAYLLP